jgi:DNA-binding transcriptional LysR family regulator
MGKSLSINDTEVFARNVDWNLFKVFLQIAQHGGIGAAGRALNRRQPSISAALKRLEDRIGVPLCVRTSRGVTLTPFGQHVLGVCGEMNATIQGLPRAATVARDGLAGVVTVSVISNLHLVAQLNAVFSDFHRQYPKIDIRLEVTNWRLVLQSLASGDVELGIGFAGSADEGLTKVPVIHQVQQLYCGLGHKFFGRTIADPAELRDEPFVMMNGEPLEYGQYCERHGLGRKVGGVADNLQERMWLIQLGMGIGFLPQPIVAASTFSDALWPLLPPEAAPVCTIYFFAARDEARTVSAQLLWDTALQHLQRSGAIPGLDGARLPEAAARRFAPAS